VQPNPAVASGRKSLIMRDEDQGCAAIPFQGEDEIDNACSRRLVEISGRLVGNENGGAGGHCARDGNALLLAARQLRWIMRKPVLEANRGKLRTGLLEGRFSARKFKDNAGQHIRTSGGHFVCGALEEEVRKRYYERYATKDVESKKKSRLNRQK
jgi:hypothetical protein